MFQPVETIDGVLIVVLLIIIWLFLLSIVVFRLYRRSRRKDPSTVSDLVGGDAELAECVASLQRDFEDLKSLSEGYVQKLGIVRYNPYNDTGGDQSFAVALLDAKGNGLVISSLHNRSITRVYSKPVVRGEEGAYPFSEEERAAIKRAMEE